MRSRVVIAVAVLGPLMWFFGRPLLTAQSPVFRDTAHYYYPQFAWANREWAEGRVPLWNPYENTGYPALADSTSSALYPGKLVFLLPLPYGTRYNLYLVGHVLLAAVGAYLLARHWQSSRPAAGLAAVSYAFGGNILFQYCNVVFLVGAAWLPWALYAAERMLVQRRLAWAVLLGAVLAVVTLGGDPQTAYHAGLLAALYAWFLWRARSPVAPAPRDACNSTTAVGRQLCQHRMTLLAVAAGSGTLLACVQILPAMAWSGQSSRAAFDVPRSLYEIPACLGRDPLPPASPGDERSPSGWRAAGAGLFGTPPRGTHHEHIYQFSLAPWRLIESVWPNISGRLFPTHRRWSLVVPAEGRIWTPSLYLGLLPLLLALGAWRWRRGPLHVQWLSCCGLLFLLAAFGGYGAGWLIGEVHYQITGGQSELALGSAVGGLYWLMVVALPGYCYFRFPAKLLVVTCLAASLLAARGWDEMGRREASRLRGVLVWLGGLSVLGALAALAAGPYWSAWMESVPADDLYGPLDLSGSLLDVRLSFVHTALLSFALLCLLARWSAYGKARRGQLVLALTAIELSIANGWMVPSAEQQIWQQIPHVQQRIARDISPGVGFEQFRVYRGHIRGWRPVQWRQHASPQRHIEGFIWDHHGLFPKHHLSIDGGRSLALIGSWSTIMSADYRAFLRAGRQQRLRRDDGVTEPPPLVLDALGARYLVLPEGLAYPGVEPCPEVLPGGPANIRLWRNGNSLPRAWIVHRWEVQPPLRQRSVAAIARRTEEVLFPNGRPRPLHEVAVLETEQPMAVSAARANLAALTEERCRIVSAHPQRIEIEAVLQQPGLVVVSDLYASGWAARVSTNGGPPIAQPILRTNRIMRGVPLKPGHQQIVMEYRPQSFYLGAVVSLIAWMALLPWMLVHAARHLRPRSTAGPLPTAGGAAEKREG